MANTPDHAELSASHVSDVEGARRGDGAAFATLMQEFGPVVDRVIRRVVRDSDDADDVAQEVWITVSARLAQLREPARFRPWLLRVARNHSLGWLRGRRDRYEAIKDDALAQLAAPLTDQPDARLAEAERRTRLWEALGRLSESDREALILRVSNDRPYEEIAHRLRISRTAAEVRVSRARARLRQLTSAAPATLPPCGTPTRTLGELLTGMLSPNVRPGLRTHVASCEDCIDRMRAMIAGADAYRQFGFGGLPLAASAAGGGHGIVGQALGRLAELLPGHSAAAPATAGSATLAGGTAGAAGAAGVAGVAGVAGTAGTAGTASVAASTAVATGVGGGTAAAATAAAAVATGTAGAAAGTAGLFGGSLSAVIGGAVVAASLVGGAATVAPPREEPAPPTAAAAEVSTAVASGAGARPEPIALSRDTRAPDAAADADREAATASATAGAAPPAAPPPSTQLAGAAAIPIPHPTTPDTPQAPNSRPPTQAQDGRANEALVRNPGFAATVAGASSPSPAGSGRVDISAQTADGRGGSSSSKKGTASSSAEKNLAPSDLKAGGRPKQTQDSKGPSGSGAAKKQAPDAGSNGSQTSSEKQAAPPAAIGNEQALGTAKNTAADNGAGAGALVDAGAGQPEGPPAAAAAVLVPTPGATGGSASVDKDKEKEEAPAKDEAKDKDTDKEKGKDVK